MSMSRNEQCFKDALEKYKEKSGEDFNVEFQKNWVKDHVTGKWAPHADEGSFMKLINSIKKTLRIQNGEQAPRPPGSANPVQFRKPDLTITTKDGRQIVVDNKFTQKDGKPDKWRTGGQSGSDQRPDYNEINKQNGGKGENLNLNKDVCKCQGEPKQVEIWKPEPASIEVPFILPIPGPANLRLLIRIIGIITSNPKPVPAW